MLYGDQGTNMSPLGTKVASVTLDFWVAFADVIAS
jgi:hypothetical protein